MMGGSKPYYSNKLRIGLLIFMFLFGIEWALAEVTVSVERNRYIVPVAELSSTQTNPDVIVVSNDYMVATLVPNRGRIIAGIQSNKGTEFIHFADEPTPKKGADGVEIIEFGGLYASVPWNTRVRQPYNLDYQILEHGPERAMVIIRGQDILTRVSVEWLFIMEKGSSIITLEAIYTNGSNKRTQTVEVAHKLHLLKGSGRAQRRYLFSNIDDVTVLTSENDRFGKSGDVMDFDAINIGSVDDNNYSIVGQLDRLGDGLAWFDQKSRSALNWSWGEDADFRNLVVWEEPRYVSLELNGPAFVLDPGESNRTKYTFSIIDNLKKNPKILPVLQ